MSGAIPETIAELRDRDVRIRLAFEHGDSDRRAPAECELGCDIEIQINGIRADIPFWTMLTDIKALHAVLQRTLIETTSTPVELPTIGYDDARLDWSLTACRHNEWKLACVVERYGWSPATLKLEATVERDSLADFHRQLTDVLRFVQT